MSASVQCRIGMNAKKMARRGAAGVELVPEFRGLIAQVPSASAARARKHALLGRALLIHRGACRD